MSAEVIPFSRPQPAPALEKAEAYEVFEGPPENTEALRCLACSERLGAMQFAFYCTRSDVRCWTCHEVQVFDE